MIPHPLTSAIPSLSTAAICFVLLAGLLACIPKGGR